jgi:hypothetical protein
MRGIINPLNWLKENLISNKANAYFTVPQMLKNNNFEEADGKGTTSNGSMLGRSTILLVNHILFCHSSSDDYVD